MFFDGLHGTNPGTCILLQLYCFFLAVGLPVIYLCEVFWVILLWAVAVIPVIAMNIKIKDNPILGGLVINNYF